MKKSILFSKLSALILALFLLLTFTACKKSETSSGKSSKASSGSTAENSGPDAGDDDLTDDENGGNESNEASTAGSKSNTSKSSKSNSSTASSVEQEIKVVNNCYTGGEKIAQNPITLKIMTRDHSNGLAKYDDSSFASYVKEKYNITLKFEVTTQAACSEKITLAYSSGQMPDMFWGMAPATSTHNPYIKKGQVIELGKYLNSTYAPNILKMFKEYPVAKYLTTFDDGKSYMIPMINDNEMYGYSYFINKTWLGNLNLSVPTTTEALYEVLKQFRDQDANKNGNKNDEIPFMISGEIDPSLYGPWGINTYWTGWTIDSTGKLFYSWTSENYRNAMRYFSKLFKEGLLDQNLRGTKAADIYAKSSSAVQTVGLFAAEGYESNCSDESFFKNYTILPLLNVQGTTPQYYYNSYETIWAEWCVLTTNNKYPECSVRLVDSFYSLEGTLLARYGAPGKDGLWDFDSKGKPSMQLDKRPAKFKTTSEWCSNRTPGYAIPHVANDAFYNLVNNANISANYSNYRNQRKTIYSKVDKTTGYPKLYLTDAQTTELQKGGDYSTLRSDMFWKFLSGTSSLDNDWNAYVTQMNKLGVTNASTIINTAYNQYKAWLKKNG